MTPRTFTDNLKRTWVVVVVYDTIVGVLSQTGLDLRQLVDDQDHVSRELDDPRKLKQVIGVIVAEQLVAAKSTVDDLFKQIVSEEQATQMVLAIYQATFDFFQSQGGVMNDALAKTQRAIETAKIASRDRMKASIDNGQMDQFLAIITNAELATEWVMAAQDPANTDLAEAWQEVIDQDVEKEKRLQTYVRLVVERGLTLPAEEVKAPAVAPPTPATAPKWTPSMSAGVSPASSVSTPDATPGASSP